MPISVLPAVEDNQLFLITGNNRYKIYNSLFVRVVIR